MFGGEEEGERYPSSCFVSDLNTLVYRFLWFEMG